MSKTKMNTISKLYRISEWEDIVIKNSNVCKLICRFEVVPIRITMWVFVVIVRFGIVLQG